MAAIQEIFDPAAYANVRQPLLAAETLPTWAYTSEEFYRAEVERIFMREWNFLGHVGMLPANGDYECVNFVGVPIVLLRDGSGEVRAFANSCRHRGAKVVEGSGNCRAFKCPYHQWVYGLDGKLRGTDGMEKTENFDRSRYGLIPIRLETWQGFIFVNFDGNAAPLMDWLGDAPEVLASYRCQDMVVTRRVEFDIKCNWKLFIENAMEEYHLPGVHGATLNLKQMEHGIIAAEGNWDAIREEHVGTRALLEEDAHHALPRIKTLEGTAAGGTHYVVLYPSTMLGMTTDCVWWLEEHPKGPNEMKLIVGSLFPKSTTELPDFEEKVKYYYRRWDKTIREDNDISEIQHEGVSSPFAQPGRLSHLEPLVHHIANWVLDRVVGNGPAD